MLASLDSPIFSPMSIGTSLLTSRPHNDRHCLSLCCVNHDRLAEGFGHAASTAEVETFRAHLGIQPPHQPLQGVIVAYRQSRILPPVVVQERQQLPVEVLEVESFLGDVVPVHLEHW